MASLARDIILAAAYDLAFSEVHASEAWSYLTSETCELHIIAAGDKWDCFRAGAIGRDELTLRCRQLLEGKLTKLSWIIGFLEDDGTEEGELCLIESKRQR